MLEQERLGLESAKRKEDLPKPVKEKSSDKVVKEIEEIEEIEDDDGDGDDQTCWSSSKNVRFADDVSYI